MSRVRNFIFPGAIFGSLILASFGYSVMARASIFPVAKSPSEVTTQDVSTENSIGSINIELQDEPPPIPPEEKSECKISSKYPDSIRHWCEQIVRHSEKNNLNPDLVAALIWQESGGDPTAYSKSGAVGLMQVMPRDGIAASFQCINGPCFVNRPSISELQKPNYNVKYGTAMLAGLLQKYGNMREALKFYGPMNVDYYYADKVLGIFNNYGG